MPSNTKEKDIITKNLKYIGLDLENIPDFLMEYRNVDFKPVKSNDDNQFKIYRYINIKDIQILLTPTNRLNTAFEKYAKAEPINQYLNQKSEDSIIKYAVLLKMFENVNYTEIERIEKEQQEFHNQIPFKVKYDNNYLWEIYYSEYTGKYFMMVTIEDMDHSCFFYLLKKQLELYNTNKDEYIFVPINYVDYTRRYLKKSEISDMEKYIWLFTKDWPQIYEVFDENNDLVMHIVGKTIVYDKIQTTYKNELPTKEDASKFYQLIKALFILQTELPHYYKFDTQIGENGELIFEYNSKVINYAHLSKFIKEEYEKYANELKNIFDKKEEEDIKLEKLKNEEREKNMEYLYKEKQVATYLECRTTVLGRIRYFFKHKNGKFVREKIKNNKKEIKEKNEIEKNISNSIIEEKEYYTIEDLIKICLELDRIQIKLKNMSLDIKALEEKIKSVEQKIKNATLYLKRIDEHKKSIFEFWKFANKDEVIGLNSGEEIKTEKEEQTALKKTFNYEEDFEDLGIEADKKQREILTKEECDAIFLTTTNVISDIQKIRKKENLNDKLLKKLKDEAKKEIVLFNTENFDIFGNVKEDKTKISTLANKKHREVEKNKMKLLEISKDMTVEEYESNITDINKKLDSALGKTKALTDVNIYRSGLGKLNTSQVEIFHINPVNAISESKEIEKINLCKLTIKEEMNLAYCTNIIYYDNNNHTLPLGMNITDKVLFNMENYKIDLKRQKIFRINQSINETKNQTKIVCVYEYEAKNIDKDNKNQ